MKGVILEKGIENFTKLNLFLPAIKEDICSYNWLITDIDSDYSSDSLVEKGYEFLSGEAFVELIKNDEYKFVWGVFSAFSKDVSLDEILSNGIPFADGYTGFWKSTVSLQNSLAITELVLWDGMLAMIISCEEDVINKFLAFYSSGKDLEEYNKSLL